MKYTGERLTTDFDATFGVIEHLHRYALATIFVKDKSVLDAACGEGYGTNLLSKYANDVTGVDIDEEAIEHARNKYSNNNINFIKSDIAKIPLADNSKDCIISFETIEHTVEQEKTISEFKRILREDGLLIISSPSKENYQKRDPNNKFHLKELTDLEFAVLLKNQFRFVEYYEQYFIAGSIIKSVSSELCDYKEFSGDFNFISSKLSKDDKYINIKFFNLIIASNSEIKNANINSLFDGKNAINNFINSKISNKNESIRNRTKNFLLFPIFIFKKIVYKISHS